MRVQSIIAVFVTLHEMANCITCWNDMGKEEYCPARNAYCTITVEDPHPGSDFMDNGDKSISSRGCSYFHFEDLDSLPICINLDKVFGKGTVCGCREDKCNTVENCQCEGSGYSGALPSEISCYDSLALFDRDEAIAFKCGPGKRNCVVYSAYATDNDNLESSVHACGDNVILSAGVTACDVRHSDHTRRETCYCADGLCNSRACQCDIDDSIKTTCNRGYISENTAEMTSTLCLGKTHCMTFSQRNATHDIQTIQDCIDPRIVAELRHQNRPLKDKMCLVVSDAVNDGTTAHACICKGPMCNNDIECECSAATRPTSIANAALTILAGLCTLITASLPK